MPPPVLLPPTLRDRLASVCVAVTAAEPASLFRNAAAALAESRFVELRFDSLRSPADGAEPLTGFCAAHPGVTVLATCRRTAGGGGFAGSIEEQLQLLARFAQAGAALVDVELETLAEAAPARLRRFREELAGAPLLVSAHDFTGTGEIPDLESTLHRLRTLGAPAQPAIYKVVSTAQGLADNLRMLRFVESAAREVPVVGLCMGVAGLPSRVLGLRSGAPFTFASATSGDPTAPGQVPVELLLGEYRAVSLSAGTQVYGVAGNPVTHSLSPALHNAGFRAAGIDAIYLPLHTTSISDLLELVRGLPLAGLSVTMPWKVEILPFLDAVDPLAAVIGAVNTVVRREDGSLFGTNTDVTAIVEPLQRRMPLQGARVLLLGAGGAARAAAFGLRAAGARVAILNRTAATAERLARASGAEVADASTLGGYDAVINATPLGMPGHQEQPSLVNADALRGTRVVFEMVYSPAETPLTRMGQALGIEVIGGLEMFAHQGIRQWELWTGHAAPEQAMRDALEAALLQQE